MSDSGVKELDTVRIFDEVADSIDVKMISLLLVGLVMVVDGGASLLVTEEL